MATYDPQGVLQAVDDHTVVVLAFLTITLVATFGYLVSAFMTASRHRAYPAPMVCVAVFAVHDGTFALYWDDWFGGAYDSWWTQAWAIALIGTTLIELALVFQIYRFGHKELMPRLSRPEFGVAVFGGLVAFAIAWAYLKDSLDDPLFMVSFAITAWMPAAGSTALLTKRGSMRGQTMRMNWCLFFVPIGLFGAWMTLDPYFREPLPIAFTAVAICWGAFNLLVMRRYPPYVPPSGGADERHDAGVDLAGRLEVQEVTHTL